MSYPYRVRVSKTVEENVNAKDKVTNTLKIDNILDDEEMKELLKAALEKRGFKEGDDGQWVREKEDGERQVVDLETMQVTTSVEKEDSITKEKTLEVVGDAYAAAEREVQREQRKREAEERLDRTLKITDDEISDKQQELIKVIGEQLQEGAEARNRELLEVVAEVQAEALKKKAATLGTVMSVDERTSSDGTDFELTIKITE